MAKQVHYAYVERRRFRRHPACVKLQPLVNCATFDGVMRWKRALVVGSVSLGILCVLAGGLTRAKPGAARALRDIAAGQPKYFYVSGPPTNEPRPWPELYTALEAKGVDVVGRGCVRLDDDDDYNAVILRHYNLSE